MTKKIIVEVHNGISMLLALEYVEEVVSMGKISVGRYGNQYCFHTSFRNNIHVSVVANKKSERFIVYKEQHNERK